MASLFSNGTIKKVFTGTGFGKAIKTAWANSDVAYDAFVRNGRQFTPTINKMWADADKSIASSAWGYMTAADKKGMASRWKYGAARTGAGLMGLGVAGRIASGGGIYRDSNGNFDIAGLPFI